LSKRGLAAQLKGLRKMLAAPADKIELRTVVPVFVPDGMASPAWPGPVIPMRVPGLAVTWAALMPDQTMRYVTHDMTRRWDQGDRDWREIAMENLADLPGGLSSHSFVRQDGSYFGAIMLHTDGVGPSRLLLNGLLEETFPDGYSCAIPERSVGVVLSASATEEERAKVTEYIDGCYERGTRPFIKGSFSPEDLVMRAPE